MNLVPSEANFSQPVSTVVGHQHSTARGHISLIGQSATLVMQVPSHPPGGVWSLSMFLRCQAGES